MRAITYSLILFSTLLSGVASGQQYSFKRFENNPIISEAALPGKDGENINGPSLIKAPDWLPNKLGNYYLYFAHHGGTHVRLAYADKLDASWSVYENGTLKLNECEVCRSHIASPDVFVDHQNKEIVMYFHAPVDTNYAERGQYSFRATSKDGINFTVDSTILGISYFRVFQWKENHYAIARTGQLYRSKDGGRTFESGPNPFDKIQTPSNYLRHAAVKVDGNRLLVFYSNIGDKPERILLSIIELNDDWNTWTPGKPVTIVKPEKDYEGANEPLLASKEGAYYGPVHQLRDPAFYEEDGRWYLIYSTAGEKALAIGELIRQ